MNKIKYYASIGLLFCSVLFAQSDIKPGSNLIVENIPAIPLSVVQDVKKYTESRMASFSSWHPVKNEMMISTRFGNTPQLHSVKFPKGARMQMTFFDEPIANSTYEPINGNYLIFSKDVGGNEFNQLYRLDFNTGNISLITNGKRSQNGNIHWNQKGTMIAYSSTRRNGKDRDFYIMNPLDTTTNTLILQNNGGGWAIEDWSDDGKQLLVVEFISANETHMYSLNVETKTVTNITPKGEKNVVYSDAHFSSDGNGIWMVTDKDNEFLRVAYLDSKTNKFTYYTSDVKWDIDGLILSKNRSLLAYTINEYGYSRLNILDTKTKKITSVSQIPTHAVISGVRFHNNNNLVAFNVQTAGTPSDVFVYTINSSSIEQWTESELGGLVSSNLSEPTLIEWNSFDTKKISGFYHNPSSKFSGKRPVIISIHGGPEAQYRPGFLGALNYFINELGVAIIFPNVRGSSGFGKTFLTLDNGMKRMESVQDIGSLLEWIGKQDNLDKNKIMITGGSYGGFMTLAISYMYSDKINCAIDVVGISNINTFLKNTESYRRDLRRVEYGDERDPKIFEYLEKIAPSNNVDKMKKPMFIVQGGNDPRVPKSEAVQMANALKKNNQMVWYLEAIDEGHGFRKKNNIDFQRYSTILFVKKFLLE